MTCPKSSNEETGARRGKKRVEALRPTVGKPFGFPEDNPNPVVLISSRGVIFYYNKAGLSLLKALGWKDGEGIPEVWRNYVEKAIESKRIQKAKGKSKEGFYAVTFVPGEGGKHVTAYGFDTTDWRLVEEKFKTLVETINDWVWEVDAGGVYTYISPKVRDLLGYEPEEVIGRTAFDLMPEEEAHRVRDIFERVLEAEEPFTGLRNVNLCRDGREVIVETSGVPIFDPEGTLIGYRGVDRDITERILIEDELRESKDFIENLVESSVDGILAFDTEYRYTVWNPAMEKLSGLRKEEVVGKCAFDVFPFLEKIGEDKFLLDALEGKTAITADRRYTIPQTAREGFFEARYSPLRSESGHILGGLGVVRDTTERKRAERAIRESEERFRQLAENIRQVFWVVAADFSEVFYVSSAYEEVWGRTCESLYENPASWIASVVEEDRGWLIEAVKKRVSGEKTEGRLPPYRITWPDGSIHWIQARSVLIKDQSGGISRIAGVAEDITESRIAEENLLKEKKFSETVINSLPGVFYLCDDQVNMVRWNKNYEDVTGYSAEEISQMKGPDFFSNEEKLAAMHRARRVLLYGETASIETSLLTKDGRRIPYYFTGLRIVMGGRPYLAGIGLDITDRRRAEEERERLLKMLEAKNKELQSVVYIASHDLRSPLVNIYGFSGQLCESCAELQKVLEEVSFSEEAMNKISPLLEEDIPQALDFIKAGANKMQMVIDGLLKISRVGTAQLTISELDMDRIVGNIVEAMNYEISSCNASVVLEELPRCAGDHDQINQAFSNLLHNAVKYLHPERKGEIKVWGKKESGMSVYCVEDNGVGIPPEHQNRVFEIFHRIDPTCGVAGEGLGLSVVSRILDRHKGKIWLESEPDRGSKFFVAIPTA